MTGIASDPRSEAAPSPSLVEIRPRSARIPLDLAELWRYRELVYFLVWRDVKVRYRQTVLGAPGRSSSRS